MIKNFYRFIKIFIFIFQNNLKINIYLQLNIAGSLRGNLIIYHKK